MKFCLFFLTLLLGHFPLKSEEPKYVTVSLMGQLGNQMFQIATAYAYALDHNLPLTVPDLVNRQADGTPYNAKTLFLPKIRADGLPASPTLHWSEPTFNYNPIPASSRVFLFGYFQSEKYFKHRRNELLALFAAPKGMDKAILKKYPFLDSDAPTVGVQIRDYRKEAPTGAHHPTYGRSYYEKAMKAFPKESIFLVSSNNPALARECTEGLAPNIIYLNANYIEEFYTLVLCKSFIISNSSFGWWASWLSTHPNKVVVAPSPWFAPPYNNAVMARDLLPPEYVVVEN